MQPCHRDLLDPERFERRKSLAPFFSLQVDPLGDCSLTVAGESERVIPVRSPGEELDATGIGRIGPDRVRNWVGPVDSRVVDVEWREPFVVLDSSIDIVSAKQEAGSSDILRSSASAKFPPRQNPAKGTYAVVQGAMQSGPTAFGVRQVDCEAGQRKEHLDPVERPRILLRDGEMQDGPPEVVSPVDFSGDDRAVRESLRAARGPSSRMGIRRFAQPGRVPAPTRASARIRPASAATTGRGVDRALQERASLGDRPRSIQCMEVDGRNVAHVLVARFRAGALKSDLRLKAEGTPLVREVLPLGASARKSLLESRRLWQRRLWSERVIGLRLFGADLLRLRGQA